MSASGLTIELFDRVLALAIRNAAAQSLWDPAAISAPLNVVSRTATLLPTKSALFQMPHVDLNVASKAGDVGLLRIMLNWSRQRGGRPLNYWTDFSGAMSSGSVAVLEWWWSESGLLTNWNAHTLAKPCAFGWIHILEWWREKGFPHLDDSERLIYESLMSASLGGHVAVLDWFLQYFKLEKVHDNVDLLTGSMISTASQAGHVSVLDWCFDKLSYSPEFSWVVIHAFRGKHVSVLEWCKSHLEVTVANYKELPNLNWNGALVLAIQSKLYRWIDTLGITPAMVEYWPASSAACKAGDLDALEWMRAKGYLVGSRHQLLDCATPSGQVQLLEWIHSHISSTTADSPNRDAWPKCDPYIGACLSGSVDVLDWLCKNTESVLESDSMPTYFAVASGDDHVAVLDWLLDHVDSAWTQENLFEVALNHALASATRKGSLAALKWWYKTLSERNLIDSEEEPVTRRTNMLDNACQNRSLGIVDWWFNQSGSLIKYFEWDDLSLKVCKSQRVAGADTGATLDVLFQCDEVGDFAQCIHVASLAGNLEVLEWFLRIVRAGHGTTDSFAEALTSSKKYAGVPVYANHSLSLLWWKARDLQVQLPINCGEYTNPIHARIIKSMKVSAKLQQHAQACSVGNLPMLMYYQAEDPLYFQKMSEEEKEACLVCASGGDHVHVLEWLKTRSGMEIKKCVCPTDAFRKIGAAAQAWWAKSGLCSHDRAE